MNLLTIEEYIARRKKEDQLNEFNLANRMENMKICVNYVFEYFNQYLDTTKLDEQTVLNNERLEKYRNSISYYDEEIQDWLVHIYDAYNKKLDRAIINFLKKDELFYLYCTESEFRMYLASRKCTVWQLKMHTCQPGYHRFISESL